MSHVSDRSRCHATTGGRNQHAVRAIVALDPTGQPRSLAHHDRANAQSPTFGRGLDHAGRQCGHASANAVERARTYAGPGKTMVLSKPLAGLRPHDSVRGGPRRRACGSASGAVSGTYWAAGGLTLYRSCCCSPRSSQAWCPAHQRCPRRCPRCRAGRSRPRPDRGRRHSGRATCTGCPA